MTNAPDSDIPKQSPRSLLFQFVLFPLGIALIAVAVFYFIAGSKKQLVNAPSGLNKDWHSYLLKASWSSDGQSLLLPDTFFPLDVIDPKSLTLTKTIPMRGRLHNIYMTPDQKYVICGSVQKKFVSVVDAKTETIVWDYQFDLGVRPMTIETNPDGSTKRIFVQLAAFDGFAALDFAKHEEVARIKLPDLHTGVDMDAGRLDAPSHGIGVHPDGKTLWVTSIPQNAVFVYSLADLKLVGQITLPELKLAGRPLGGAVANWVTFTEDGKTIYISNSGLRSVTAIDTASMKIKAVIPVGEVPKRINTLVMN